MNARFLNHTGKRDRSSKLLRDTDTLLTARLGVSPQSNKTPIKSNQRQMYSIAPWHGDRYQIFERGELIAWVYNPQVALRIARALADAEVLKIQVAALEQRPVSIGQKFARLLKGK